MRHRMLAVGGAFIALVTLAAGAYISRAAEKPTMGHQNDGRVPVLVELFTSEGCSSCPPADAILARYVREQPVPGARIIAIGEHVDYWNRLGWKDPFSSPRFTQRQGSYARALNLSQVYTPQVIVNGEEEFVGSDEQRLRASVTQAAATPRAHVSLEGNSNGRYTIRATDLPGEALLVPGEKIEVYAAVTEDGLTSAVSRGENAGRRLTHAAVVRRLERIGIWNPAAKAAYETTFSVPTQPRQHVIIFLQTVISRRIVGAAESG